MIETDKRKAIDLLHQEGMSQREIARRLQLGRNTVHRVIGQQGQMVPLVRPEKQPIDPELLRRLHQDCEGRVQRMHEKLVEEEGIAVKYSTLTRKVRALGLGEPPAVRCHQVPDEPGREMQHDTTVYRIKLGEQSVPLVASLIYLRYSKRRYLKFYRHFTRFQMKCFFHQALMHWGYCAPDCIIDNTNLARLRGLGKNAVIVPEMVALGREHGFRFICHERGHANRKAGEERSFFTVETNFLPGRTFSSLEDLQQQAWAWATERMEQRPQTKAGIIPAKAFEHERSFLIKLPSHLPAPYQVHHRLTDQYGYITFDANYYWVPGTDRAEVRVLQYAEQLKIYKDRNYLAEYVLPPDGTRNQRFSPPGLPLPPQAPKNRRHPTEEEEKRLRALGPTVSTYLDWVLPRKGLGRHRFLRRMVFIFRTQSIGIPFGLQKAPLWIVIPCRDCCAFLLCVVLPGGQRFHPSLDIIRVGHRIGPRPVLGLQLTVGKIFLFQNSPVGIGDLDWTPHPIVLGLRGLWRFAVCWCRGCHTRHLIGFVISVGRFAIHRPLPLLTYLSIIRF